MRSSLHERIRYARRARNLTSEAVARQLGIDRSLYSRYENGDRTPDTPRLVQIAQVLGVPLAQLADLPLRNVVVYSDGLLDSLEAKNQAVQSLLSRVPSLEYSDYNGWKAWQEKVDEVYNQHKKILDQVLDERNAALEFPDLGVPLDQLVGQTIKQVTLDLRGEVLIGQGLHLEFDLLNAKYSAGPRRSE